MAVSALHADFSVLHSYGPNSGLGFSNIGSTTKTIPRTILENADVAMTIKAGKGADLLLDCLAKFELLILT
jgi:hypothetical protein